ncbi:hypothetical protein SAMN04490357_0058 [Streptomyces misionensis]|uniref:Uncharacterized protein n=1 Tax=Streptomyces misionensis TaxID=67331 RepID=A0A1H4I9M7_9ACTN|nr:hypothetical protein SAMN04490357_0058 [Streptomyces misionensis]
MVRDILADLEGVVRWGGDDSKPDESLFYIDIASGDESLTRVANKVRTWNYTPGMGPGVVVDPLLPKRRLAAKRVAAQQT